MHFEAQQESVLNGLRGRVASRQPDDELPSIGSMLRVTDVEPIDDSDLRVVFTDRVVREIDCNFLVRGTLGRPLRDPEYFRRVRADEDSRTIVWPNGLDPSPELLRDYLSADAAPDPGRRAAA